MSDRVLALAVARLLCKVGDAAAELVRELEAQGAASPKPPPAAPQFMTVRAFAKATGFSESTIRAWLAAGLPSVPAGRGKRIDFRQARAWLDAGGAKRAAASGGRRFNA